MSRPTLPPPPAGFSPDEIAAQVAEFEAKGGKVKQLGHGEVARNPKDMQAIQDENLRKAAERTKAAGVGSVNIKRKRGPDLRLGKRNG